MSSGSYVMAAIAAALLATTALPQTGCHAPSPETNPSPEVDVLLDRAGEEERARQYHRARRLYERALDRAIHPPDRARVGRRFASALLRWGEVAEAESRLEDVVAADLEMASAWHDLGVLRARRGATAGAERALRRAVALEPRDPRPRLALASLLVNQRRYAEALSEYHALLELDGLPEEARRAIPRAMELLREEEFHGRGAAAPEGSRVP